jgi:CO/xanthine dehydrogenase Mo-binding subunit
MHAQIVADAMGIPYDQVEVAPVDTSIVPDSGPTVASRTCMVVGRILERSAEELKNKLGGLAPAEYFKRHGPLRVEKEHVPPEWLKWDEERYRGDAYATYAWACDVAEVEMDRDTFEVRPLRITAVQDIGKAIHPALATGQIEGGTGQGVGFALIEQVVMKNGAMANAQLTNYTIPTTLDTPAMDVVLVENPFPEGPFGAKGLGELPIDGPAPAIVNAIRSLGVDVREVPATPELLFSAISSRRTAERYHDLLTYDTPAAPTA